MGLGLRALEFFIIDVGEDARDLAVAFFVRYDFGFAFLHYRYEQNKLTVGVSSY